MYNPIYNVSIQWQLKYLHRECLEIKHGNLVSLSHLCYQYQHNDISNWREMCPNSKDKNGSCNKNVKSSIRHIPIQWLLTWFSSCVANALFLQISVLLWIMTPDDAV